MTQTKSEIVIDNYFDTDCKDLILSQFIKEAYSRGFKRAVEKMRPCTGYWITDGIVDENGNIQCYCSNCQAGDVQNVDVPVFYCWHCGCKMKEGNNEYE